MYNLLPYPKCELKQVLQVMAPYQLRKIAHPRHRAEVTHALGGMNGSRGRSIAVEAKQAAGEAELRRLGD